MDVDSDSAAYADHALHDLAPPLPKPATLPSAIERIRTARAYLDKGYLLNNDLAPILKALLDHAIETENQLTSLAYRDSPR
jgi:hypothetical protein